MILAVFLTMLKHAFRNDPDTVIIVITTLETDSYVGVPGSTESVDKTAIFLLPVVLTHEGGTESR